MTGKMVLKNRKALGVGVLLFLCIFLLLLASVAAYSAAPSGSIKWYGYDEGLSLGKKGGKKIFMFFWADWCNFCELMETETFTKPKIIKYLNDNFISIKVNSDAEKGIATRYFVRGLPTMWFLGNNGEKIGYHPGYVASDMFLPYLRYIQSDKYKNMSFQDFLGRS